MHALGCDVVHLYTRHELIVAVLVGGVVFTLAALITEFALASWAAGRLARWNVRNGLPPEAPYRLPTQGRRKPEEARRAA